MAILSILTLGDTNGSSNSTTTASIADNGIIVTIAFALNIERICEPIVDYQYASLTATLGERSSISP